MKISIIIPVYNEQGRLEKVLENLQGYYEVIIIDDSSSNKVNSYISSEKYPNVHIETNMLNRGYLFSIKKGISIATGDVIVTMDGDGEHKPKDITKLVEKIQSEDCDIVFGKRPHIARPSERVLLRLARFLTGSQVKDTGTGFRAIRAKYAKELHFYGGCTCGTLLQECDDLGMKICETEVDLPIVDKPRTIAWDHIFQFFSILKFYLKTHIKGLD